MMSTAYFFATAAIPAQRYSSWSTVTGSAPKFCSFAPAMPTVVIPTAPVFR